MEMEAVVLVSIAVLTVLFVASLIGLILACRYRYSRPLDFISPQFKDARPERNLITNDNADLELDDVRLHPNIERILVDEHWTDDATGLIPPCLTILKKCHHLTEQLGAMMMAYLSRHPNTDFTEITEITKKITPRVDEIVNAMDPPVDARLLEARNTALISSVSHLALLSKTLCKRRHCKWIDSALADMEDNLQVLKEAAKNMENAAPHTVSALPEYRQGVVPNGFITVHHLTAQVPVVTVTC